MKRFTGCNHLLWLLEAVALVVVLCPDCHAQEAGSIDLTEITPRLELRRPPRHAGDPIKRMGSEHEFDDCPENSTASPIRATLIGLDRSEYEEGDHPKAAVRITNVGSSPLKIPFSPHLAALQPENPGAKFAYSVLVVELWIIAGKAWSSNTGGRLGLYGSDDHPETMLTLHPGEWAEIIGEANISFPPDISPLARIRNPVTAMNVEVAIQRKESLFTSTEAATVSHRVCLSYTQGPDLPAKVKAAVDH